MIVRPAMTADAGSFADILNPLIEEGNTTALSGLQTAERWADLAAGRLPDRIVHVAEDEGTILGFQFLEPYRGFAPTERAIATFARIGAAQRGIGTALFSHTKPAAQAAGVTSIVAVIRKVNAGGIRYYSRMGFGDRAEDGDRVVLRLNL